MFYTIYKVTNTVTGKIYIGSHKTKNLQDGYMGSGKYINHAINKYGIENFTKEILFVFDTPEEMYAKEAEIVNEDFISDQNTYNLKIGGFGGWDYVNNNLDLKEFRANNAKSIPIESKRIGGKKVGKLNALKWKLDPERRPFIFTKEFNIEASKNAQSSEARQKRKDSLEKINHQKGEKNSQYNTVWIYSEELQKSKKISKDEDIPEGWKLGRKIKF